MIMADFFSVTKDIVLTLTAVTGSYVAVRGLNTWKRQLSGQVNYNLSKNLLMGLFKYRDAINFVRYPIMTLTSDLLPEEGNRLNMNAEEIRFFSVCNAYGQRWKDVSEVSFQLYTHLTEAEAIWGDEISHIWKSVQEKEMQLHSAIREYLDLKNPNDSYSISDISQQEYMQLRRVICEGGRNDAFKKEFEDKLNKMISYIRGKLKS